MTIDDEITQMRLPFKEEEVYEAEKNVYLDELDYSLEELEQQESYRFFVTQYHIIKREKK